MVDGIVKLAKMVPENKRVRIFAAINLAFGIMASVLFLVSYTTTRWISFHTRESVYRVYFLSRNYTASLPITVHMGLWEMVVCLGEKCVFVYELDIDDIDTEKWSATRGLMSICLALACCSCAINGAMLLYPTASLSVVASVLWFFTGAFNLIAVIVFRSGFNRLSGVFSWGHWIAVVSGMLLLLIGIVMGSYTWNHEWPRETPQQTVSSVTLNPDMYYRNKNPPPRGGSYNINPIRQVDSRETLEV